MKTETNKGFKALFIHLHKPLLLYSVSLIADEDTSYEIVQEAFLQLWERRDRLTDGFNAKAYLYKCVHNQAFNYLRHLRIVQAHQSQYNFKSETNKQNEDYIFIEQAINNALDKLPARQRLIFELSRLDGCKHEQIAEQLNISYKTVEAQIRNARLTLQKHLKNYYHELK
jgi:RNA polymerase sigma-70 factor, ECF subfamily